MADQTQRKKKNCRALAGYRKRTGKLKRRTCGFCGAPAEMHHD